MREPVSSVTLVRAVTNWALVLISTLLLIVSFPDFNLWPLAWAALVPLLIAISRKPAPFRAFLLGWLLGSVFFYVSCYWLTYSMVHYGEISEWRAYALLVPGALVIGVCPAGFAAALAQVVKRWGTRALFAAPLLWVAFEWVRLAVTGQLWNAIGYSQAFHPSLIQSARWGGVYAVGFLIVGVNAAIAFAILNHTAKAMMQAALIVAIVGIIIIASNATAPASQASDQTIASVVALQPNVPMNGVEFARDARQLIDRHLSLSEGALRDLKGGSVPRVVIWPESPMNFRYAQDSEFRDLVARFTRDNHTALIFNSQEPAPDNGSYNSALMVNEEGRLIAQYDKIRLMPFGEYVPLPHWLPGASAARAIVGDFTPGTKYTLMPIGGEHAGVFICIESAYPWIARSLSAEGAEVLINISNDGYLGPTAVMRQHLSNVVFRAVENGRPLLRVTNTGISAYITPDGKVKDATQSFQPAVRTWTIPHTTNAKTFYTKHGDLFVEACAVLSLLVVALSLVAINRTRAIRQ